MTRTEILFNYRQAIRQAEKLEQLSKKLKQVSDRDMDSAVGTLKNAWQSDNSGRYFSKAEKVMGDILTSAENLSSISAAIRQIAKTVRDAELRALEIAKNRTYH